MSNSTMKKVMFFLHHFFRPIWTYPITFAYFLYYLFKGRDRQKVNMQKWAEIKSVESLVYYFRNSYIYQYDGPKGLFDHDNPKNEFFYGFIDPKTGQSWEAKGDCDEMGKYSMMKLKELGFKATRIGILNRKDMKSWHYDCMFERDGKYVLFNYGNLVEADSKDNCIVELGKVWEDYAGDTVVWWRCYW